MDSFITQALRLAQKIKLKKGNCRGGKEENVDRKQHTIAQKTTYIIGLS